ncbi:MAG: hypothetical protein KIT22_06960 [Verrucomicrobiae bacterium]|nr:hypothetical protein [Verrucomicrobiae bacterium]
MKPMFFALLALTAPAAVAQQVLPGVSSAGANGMPAVRPGGISYVTRPTPAVNAGIAAASFFAASGVPLNPPASPNGGAGAGGGAVAAPVVVASRPQNVPPNLQALAASGDARARTALNLLRATERRPAAVLGR